MPVVEREKLIHQCEVLTPGLGTGDVVEQSACFIFGNGRVFCFNDEVACSVGTELDIQAAVAAVPLLGILRKMPDKELQVDLGDGILSIKGVGSKRETGIRMDKDIKVSIDDIVVPNDWNKLPPDFSSVVDIACQCASKDADKFELSCVHVHPNYLETCDDYQLIRCYLKVGFGDSIIRRSVLQNVSNMMAVEFSETDCWIHFRSSSGMVMSCRKYSENYPSLDALMDFTGVKSSLPDGIDGVVSRASVFVDSNKAGRVVIELRKGKMRISGIGDDGWFRETLDTNFDGDSMKFSISPKLLLEVSKRSKDWEITEGRFKVSTEKWTYVSCVGKCDN